MTGPIILLCSDCFSSTVLYNYISRFYAIDQVIVENPLRGWALAKRRFKKIGYMRVIGQILFSVIIVSLLRAGSKKRIATIKDLYGFDETPIGEEKKKRVESVNKEDCIELVKKIRPAIILVNGTRILSKKFLADTDAVIINMHTGITPRYRGVHGGYWAIVNNDEEHCGVTVHLVDKGIDTGGILGQAIITINRKDNFVTYPFHQFGEGLPLVHLAVEAVRNNRVKTQPPLMTDSKLWYHPTIWQYLYYRIFKNKK